RLDADDALVLGLVREQRRAGDVADGVDAGHTGAVERIDHDGAAVGLPAKLFAAGMVDVSRDAPPPAHPLPRPPPPPPPAVRPRHRRWLRSWRRPSCRVSSPWRRSGS